MISLEAVITALCIVGFAILVIVIGIGVWVLKDKYESNRPKN